MVQDANVKRMNAEKLLKEANSNVRYTDGYKRLRFPIFVHLTLYHTMFRFNVDFVQDICDF